MRKYLIPLVFLLSLTSCSNSTNVEYSRIIISQVLKSSSSFDRALEIGNISDKEVDLSDYTIKIYNPSETEPSQIIHLSGTLAANDAIVFVHPQANNELLSKADYLIDDLKVDGTWPITLNRNNKLVDIVGVKGYRIDYAYRKSLVRKKEFLSNKGEFNAYDWIKYPENEYSLLGNLDVTLTEEELLEGPKLTEENFNLPFVKNGTGTGGAVKVSLISIGDGDTTRFGFPSSVTGDVISYNESVRYLGINTPETQHGTAISAEPWGYAAKDYNNEILRNATHFVVQTCKDGAIRETYDRLLGFVWYSNVDNPKPEDYRCLNYEMVKEAYASQLWIGETLEDDPNLYKKLSYIAFFDNAELKAKNEGKKIHGERDPNFDY